MGEGVERERKEKKGGKKLSFSRLIRFTYSRKMLRRTAAGAAASAAAAAAPSSSSCGPDYHEDHKNENGIAAKRPPVQRRRSVSKRTIMLVAAIAGSIVLSLARHFWSSASSPGEFERTRGLAKIRERSLACLFEANPYADGSPIRA